MRAGRGLFAVIREAATSAVTLRVFSVVTFLVLAGGTFVILTTAGKAAAAQDAVLGRIDAQGTRTVVVQAKGPQVGLSTQTVDQLMRYGAVEAAVGFGPVQDATAAAVPDGSKVGVRLAYGRLDGVDVIQPEHQPGLPVAWASPLASEQLGLPAGAGAVRLVDGPERLIVRSVSTPPYLSSFEPLLVVPAERGSLTRPQPVVTIAVLARSPQEVDAVAASVRRLLADVPADKVSVETASAMADLRSAVSGELTRQSRAIVLGLLGAATAATLLNVWGMVLTRRKDFGRRRALGASRLMIVILIVVQVTLVALLGAVTGAVVGNAWLSSGGGTAPPVTYSVSVVVALVAAAAAAAAIPAAVAANRDPIRELRVP